MMTTSRMIVIAVPVDAQAPLQDFRGLEQDSIPWTRQRGGSGLNALLSDAVFGSGSSGAMRGAGRSDRGQQDAANVVTYAWTLTGP